MMWSFLITSLKKNNIWFLHWLQLILVGFSGGGGDDDDDDGCLSLSFPLLTLIVSTGSCFKMCANKGRIYCGLKVEKHTDD